MDKKILSIPHVGLSGSRIPCKECIALAMCKHKLSDYVYRDLTLWATLSSDCPMLLEYYKCNASYLNQRIEEFNKLYGITMPDLSKTTNM